MDCLRDKFIQGELLDDRFLTVAPLNHGSFGMVFLATDITNGEQVAIKCLTKPSSTESSGLAVDERSEELECHTRLSYHTNLVNLIHSFETNSHIFLVLEYCSMGDLYEAIRNNRGPGETEHVREFMLQLVSAVEFMHSKGLYHRDIKPENIFLCQDGSMKLGDFGLATRSPWSFEACVGSDRYMAPEQYEPTTTGYSTAHADIWSIGICLLNILFARNPFVTPTESDVLFADYTRDRQSLFDVFPNMSQDTFEILSHAMSLDPKKRSLASVRQAILRAVCFTTDDETLDGFCTEDRDLIPASAFREPLRTPSIQSPQVNQGDSFPWMKALQSSPPHAVRQLSAIADSEIYTEDLFPASENEGMSWYSLPPGTPSVASVLDSTLGASFRSLAIRQPERRHPPSAPVPISGSLPARHGRPTAAVSIVFGKDDCEHMSKSWSDLWDEDESENEDIALHERKEQHCRSWSLETCDDEYKGPAARLAEIKSSSPVNSGRLSLTNAENGSAIPTPRREVDSTGGFHHFHPSRYSPPKQSIMDRWAALGNRRRNYHSKEETTSRLRKQQSMNMNWRKDWGVGSSSLDSATWTRKDTAVGNDHRHHPLLDRDWRRHPFRTIKTKRSYYTFPNPDCGVEDEFDLVGGWHDLHL
jgi:serine/threonine protein kinase